jgi:hypothetical protein
MGGNGIPCADDPGFAFFKIVFGDGTVIQKKTFARLSVAAFCLGGAAIFNVAQAFDFGNMMNPSRWFDNNDRYDRGYYRGGYGPYGWGGGPYGWGGGPYGWGGYGYPGYGGYGGYGGGPSTIVVNPSDKSSDKPAPAPRLPE